jgi:hypothetical protein
MLMTLQQSNQVVLLLVKKYGTYPVVAERHKTLECRAVEEGRDEDLVEHRGRAYQAKQGAHRVDSIRTY